METKIKIGTASWQDPGFIRDWYPKDLPKYQLLPWYAERFHYVEVNSTFYHIPERQTIERWSRQTPKGFTFDLKLHKLLSHHSTKPDDIPEELRYLVAETGKRVERTPELEQAVLRLTLDAVQPLASTGKLGAFLLQMSPSFRPKYHSLNELMPVLEALDGHPLALELRNRDWINPEIAPKVFDFCEDHEISLVMVDAPQTTHFMALPEFEAVTKPNLAYLRLHGRNAEGYVRGRSVSERFNYDYSADELEEVADKIARVAEEAREVHVVFNNNYGDYAPKDAQALQEIVHNRIPVAA